MMIDLSKEGWEVAYQAGGETDLATAKMLITGADGWLLVGWEGSLLIETPVQRNLEDYLKWMAEFRSEFWFQTGVDDTKSPDFDLGKVFQICNPCVLVHQLVHAITVAQGKARV